MNKNIKLFTCNIDNYSPVKHHYINYKICTDNGIKYTYYTNEYNKYLPKDVQTIIIINSNDYRKEAKKYKVTPSIKNDTTIYAWIDANIKVKKAYLELLNVMKDDILLFAHDKRDNILSEAEECIRSGKDKKNILNRQIGRYIALYPEIEKLGLYQGRIIARKNNSIVSNFNNMWMDEINNGSIRDQISLPVALDRAKLKKNVITNDYNKYFAVVPHSKYKMYGQVEKNKYYISYIKYKINKIIYQIKNVTDNA